MDGSGCEPARHEDDPELVERAREDVGLSSLTKAKVRGADGMLGAEEHDDKFEAAVRTIEECFPGTGRSAIESALKQKGGVELGTSPQS